MKDLYPKFNPSEVEWQGEIPARWSILNKTIPILLELDELVVNELWEHASTKTITDIVSLSKEEWKKIAAYGLFKDDQCDVLLALATGYIINIGINSQSFEVIYQEIASLAGIDTTFLSKGTYSKISNEAIIGETEFDAIRKFRIDSFDVPKDCLDELYNHGIHTWGELTLKSEKLLLDSQGFNFESLRGIQVLWKMKQLGLMEIKKMQGLPLECYSSFSRMLEAFVETVCNDERDHVIFLNRFGLIDNSKTTFDEIGETFGLTRERVRQICQKILDKLKSPVRLKKLSRFWAALFETLKLSGGACLLTEISSGIAERLEWNEEPGIIPLTSVLKLHNKLAVNTSQAVVSDPKSPCFHCTIASSVLVALLNENKDEMTVQNVAEHLLKECRRQSNCECRGWRFTEGYLRMLTERTESVVFEDGVFCSKSVFSAKHGSRVQVAERIFRSAGRPMHLSEVCEELNRNLSNDKAVSLHNVSIEDWLAKKLNCEVPLTGSAMIDEVLSAHFPNGFRIDSSIELLRFRRFAANKYGDEVALTDDELKKSIATCGTFFDGKVYVVSSGTEERIKNEIETAFKNGTEIIFYEAFYEKHEDWLFPANVISVEMLKSILFKLYPKFTCRGNYLTDGVWDGTELAKIEHEIINVWGEDVLLNYEQLAERLPYVPLEKIKDALTYSGDFIWNSEGVYTHVNRIDIIEEERTKIAYFSAKGCRADGYISLSDVPLGKIEERNYELSLSAIHDAVFRICLADNFDKSGKIVTHKGDMLDARSIIQDYCHTIDKCSLDDLLDYEKKLTGGVHRWIPIEAGYAVLVRTDKNAYIAEKYVDFDVAAIDRAIDFFVTGEYLPLRAITIFAAFPHCGHVWNLFLLESYCRRFSEKYRFEVLAVNSKNVGAIVRKSCRLSYAEIMADAVAKSNIPLERAEVLDFLCSNGYIGRRSYANADKLIEQAKIIRELRD